MPKQLKLVYGFGPFLSVPEQNLLLRDGQTVPLAAKGFEILHVLIRNHGFIVGKDELMNEVWPDTFVEESSLTQNISVLRRALGESRKEPQYIETVQGRGYRFIAPVTQVNDTDAELIIGQRANIEDPGAALGLDGVVNTLIILPLVNRSADPDTEYLSDGITDSLINTLSQLSGLRVMSRSTVFRYKGQEVDAQRIGRELKAQMVFTGRVLKLGERLVISAELVRTSDGSHIWGEQYNRQNSDVIAIQEEIAEEITTKLRLKLSSEEKRRLAKRSTGNVEAYHLYLKGCYFRNKYTLAGLSRALEYFERAIEVEPRYALAHSGLADAYLRLSDSWLVPREVLPKAMAAAAAAVELDDSLAEAHASLGLTRMFYDHDWPGAGEELRRAIKLNPGSTTARRHLGSYLIFMGRPEEALAEARSALEMEPLSLQANASIGVALYLMGQYDRAIYQLDKALELDPNYPPARMTLGRVYAQMGKLSEAIGEFEWVKRSESDSHVPLGLLGYAYGVLGKRREAETVISELTELAGRRYVSPYSMAITYVGLGMRDQALDWLERAYEDRTDWLVWLKVGPELNSLRAYPRFAELLRRVGFTE